MPEVKLKKVVDDYIKTNNTCALATISGIPMCTMNTLTM